MNFSNPIKYTGLSSFSPDGKYYMILINTETSNRIQIHDSSKLNKSD